MSLLPETSRRVNEIVTSAQSAGRVPSLVLGVVRDRALACFTGAGEAPRPDAKTQYRIGSITKTMTAAMVMQLRDEGAFSLDDLVYRHLPGTSIGGVTLRQLLAHVAGLQREPDGDWWARTTGGDTDTLIEGLSFEKISWPPYRTYHYSNLAYGVLGAVLHRVTGETWPSLLAKRVIDPLGMKRTTYHPVEPFARGHVVHPWQHTLAEQPRTDAGAMAPAGQLWSTITDLAKWAGFLADPVPTVLSRETVAEMCAPVAISDLESWTHGHGLGVELFRVGERVFTGHGGSMPGYAAQLTVHRPTRTGVVAFTNAHTMPTLGGLRTVTTDALTAVLDLEPPLPRPWRATGTPPPDDALPLCGRWWWMGREYEITWHADAAELRMTCVTLPDRTAWHFRQEAPARWRGRTGSNAGEVLTPLLDDAGTVTSLNIATAVFTRAPD
ncbi:CubicO group peptidase (beta-lactamase class C family) [Catenuloplanes nepalensis]|uniref:CubicO group peptidase (Beta-lactamase class C family) n=1 Tax=Catenuloplanes nepalensis TaxID=587533 RepID=A0ABT9MLA2_9ACTN|nr:serine hydrolase domain-containing protein [Catenuloplanes nepalensis]MDP9792200.1 CubicO group peptidase (beta-lactamase class C family) [Catenuloplanes nepalensis]